MDTSPKKQEILKAASECFARFGYEKTTLDDIGKMVGLNKASLYYYYKNKEDIFAEVVLQETKEYMQAVVAKIQAVTECKEKIVTYLREKVRHMQQLVNLHNLSIESIEKFQPVFERLRNEFYEKEVNFIIGILTACMEKNEMNPCDAKRIAESILTVMEAIKIKAFHGIDVRFADTIDYKEVENETVFIVSLILDGLMKNK